MKINGEYLNNLQFADDVALVASSNKGQGAMLHELSGACETAGLKMNLFKTKMINNQNTIYDLKIIDKEIDEAESVLYLR